MKLYVVTIIEVDLTSAASTPLIEHWVAQDADEIRECVLQGIENDNANLSGEKAYHLISVDQVSEVRTVDGKTAHLRAAFRFT